MIMIEEADRMGVIKNIIQSIMDNEVYEVDINVDDKCYYITGSNAYCIPTLENCNTSKVIGMLASAKNISLVNIISIKDLIDVRSSLIAAICNGDIYSISYTIKDKYNYHFSKLDDTYWKNLSDGYKSMDIVKVEDILERLYNLPITVNVEAEDEDGKDWSAC